MKQYVLTTIDLDLVDLGDFDHINDIKSVEQAIAEHKAKHGPVLVYLDGPTAERWKDIVRANPQKDAYFVIDDTDFSFSFLGRFPNIAEAEGFIANSDDDILKDGHILINSETATGWLR